EEAEPGADLLHDLPADRLLARRERERVEPRGELLHRARLEGVDRAVAERHRPRLRPEPRAVARGAAGARHVALEVRGPRDAPEVLHRRDEARDRLQVLALHLLAAGRLV